MTCSLSVHSPGHKQHDYVTVQRFCVEQLATNAPASTLPESVAPSCEEPVVDITIAGVRGHLVPDVFVEVCHASLARVCRRTDLV